MNFNDLGQFVGNHLSYKLLGNGAELPYSIKYLNTCPE